MLKKIIDYFFPQYDFDITIKGNLAEENGIERLDIYDDKISGMPNLIIVVLLKYAVFVYLRAVEKPTRKNFDNLVKKVYLDEVRNGDY